MNIRYPIYEGVYRILTIYGRKENASGGKRQSVYDVGRFLQTRVSEYARTGRRGILPLYQ